MTAEVTTPEEHRHGRLLDILDEVDARRERLAEALARLAEVVEATRRDVSAGAKMSSVHSAIGLGPVRKEVSDGLAALNSVLMHARAEGIRLMVDEEGLSLRDVARLVGHSRQFVSRLYHHAAGSVASTHVDPTE